MRHRSITTIAGKRLLECPDCGATVREDLLANHHTRCPGRQQMQTPQPSTASLSLSSSSAVSRGKPKTRQHRPNISEGRVRCSVCGLQVPAVHYQEHLARCQTQRARGVRREPVNQDTEKAPPRTNDGYLIDRCWFCGRRICLVTDTQHGDLVYEISHDRHRGGAHLCDGAKSGNRRTKLTYVNSKIGSIAPDQSRGSRRKI